MSFLISMVAIVAFAFFCRLAVEVLRVVFCCKSRGPLLHSVKYLDDRTIRCSQCGTGWRASSVYMPICADGDIRKAAITWERMENEKAGC